MMYKRGDIWWAKYKRHGNIIRTSLKTTSAEVAEIRHARILEANRKFRKVRKEVKLKASNLKIEGDPDANFSLDSERGRLLIKNMYSGMKSRARKRNLLPCMSKEDLIMLLEESTGVCCLTGIALDFHTKLKSYRVSPWMPSIDRIDSSKGYTKDNCRIVCYLANLAMSQFGEEALEALLVGYANTNWSHRPSKGRHSPIVNYFISTIETGENEGEYDA